MGTELNKVLSGRDWTEREREKLFREKGPFVHLHTPSVETDMIYHSKEERCVSMAYMAIAAEETHVEILAYALMTNHFHFVLRGENANAFFVSFIRRLGHYLSWHGRPGVVVGLKAEITEITSLKQLRDEIIYVIRNPFVVREDIHVFAYPWTSGFLYFNPFLAVLSTTSVDGMSVLKKRTITKSRDAALPVGLTMLGTFVNPASFVNFKLVELLFQSARHFVQWTLKNVEAQVETALRLGEKPTLTEEELLAVTLKLCKTEAGTVGTKALDDTQRFSLAKRLKYDYHASNGQIARLLHIPLRDVNAFFPFCVKK